jgi:hypothetical protein
LITKRRRREVADGRVNRDPDRMVDRLEQIAEVHLLLGQHRHAAVTGVELVELHEVSTGVDRLARLGEHLVGRARFGRVAIDGHFALALVDTDSIELRELVDRQRVAFTDPPLPR